MSTPVHTALLALAQRVADTYRLYTDPRAILLTGSVADGMCDGFSDIDMSMYYDTLPTPDQLAQARAALGAQDAFFLAPPTEETIVEDFRLDGVECQLGHDTIPSWEHTLDQVLVEYDLSPRGWDDALDVWGVHGVGGALGTILTGMFAVAAINGVRGLLAGGGHQFGVQVAGVAIAALYAFAVAYGILKVINLLTPVRVSAATEQNGLDEELHGEAAYDLPGVPSAVLH